MSCKCLHRYLGWWLKCRGSTRTSLRRISIPSKTQKRQSINCKSQAWRIHPSISDRHVWNKIRQSCSYYRCSSQGGCDKAYARGSALRLSFLLAFLIFRGYLQHLSSTSTSSKVRYLIWICEPSSSWCPAKIGDNTTVRPSGFLDFAGKAKWCVPPNAEICIHLIIWEGMHGPRSKELPRKPHGNYTSTSCWRWGFDIITTFSIQ